MLISIVEPSSEIIVENIIIHWSRTIEIQLVRKPENLAMVGKRVEEVQMMNVFGGFLICAL